MHLKKKNVREPGSILKMSTPYNLYKSKIVIITI